MIENEIGTDAEAQRKALERKSKTQRAKDTSGALRFLSLILLSVSAALREIIFYD